jgi:hypothetical protein
MYWKLVEMAIEQMDSQHFEDFVCALVELEHPTARQLKPPDAGRDTVVDLGDGTELAWQAKHHASGIDWGRCEESLQRALAERNPREMTFVFPVAMTEGKEPGLEDLRRRYPQIALPEPWTLGTLLHRLRKADDVRRELIDRPIGIDALHVQTMLERAAERDRKADQASTAAMAGPLAALGHGDALDGSARRLCRPIAERWAYPKRSTSDQAGGAQMPSSGRAWAAGNTSNPARDSVTAWASTASPPCKISEPPARSC